MTAILDSNQCGRFCGPTPNHSDNGSYIHFAEAVGFEPTEPFGSLVFKTSAIDQLCQTSNLYVLRKQKDSNLRNLSVRHVSSVLV